MIGQFALADCTYTGDTDIVMDQDRFIKPVKIDSSQPVGSTLASIFIAENLADGITVNCTTYPVSIRTTSTYPEIEPGLFKTGINGIGMKLIMYNGPSGPLPTDHIITAPGAPLLVGPVFQFIFIKTGYIPANGELNSGLFAETRDLTPSNSSVARFYLPQAITLNLLRPTCTVTTQNLTVNLGDISVLDFNTSGRTRPKNFSIDLDCQGGTNPADIYVTLTDANNPGNTTSQLGLSPDSDAEGIALEVNNQFGVVNFGPDLSGIGNPGQWRDGAVGVGSYSIPLSVNYVRLPGPIKGGSANSGVTYTLNYD